MIGFLPLIVLSAAWVAYDSTKYDWDGWAHPTRPDWTSAATSPATWFTVTLLLWPIFFPGYFWDRHYAKRLPR